jgi:hypothetical protein
VLYQYVYAPQSLCLRGGCVCRTICCRKRRHSAHKKWSLFLWTRNTSQRYGQRRGIMDISFLCACAPACVCHLVCSICFQCYSDLMGRLAAGPAFRLRSAALALQVATWGVFPRPENISKTYGGGRTIKPGEVTEATCDWIVLSGGKVCERPIVA